MCGIWFIASLRDSAEPPADESTDAVERRGPDGISEKRWVVQLHSGKWLHMRLVSSVLHMQGEQMTPQPVALHVHTAGSETATAFLAWNGELYDVASQSGGASDTQHVAAAVSDALASSTPAAALATAMAGWRGPWAAAIVDEAYQRLWFARDPIGRRSLLLAQESSTLRLASVAKGALTGLEHFSAHEVQPGKLFSVDLSTLACSEVGEFAPGAPSRPLQDAYDCFPAVSWAGGAGGGCPAAQATDAAARALLCALSSAVQKRVCGAARGLGPSPLPKVRTGAEPGAEQTYCGVACDIRKLPNVESSCAAPAHIAIMFSGGIDCMLIAALAHRHVPADETIDLINVAFAQKQGLGPITHVQSPDRAAAQAGLAELRQACPGRSWRLIQVNEDLGTLQRHQGTIVALNFPRDSTMDFSIAAALWCGARGVGWVHPFAGTEGGVGGGQDAPFTSASQVHVEQLCTMFQAAVAAAGDSEPGPAACGLDEATPSAAAAGPAACGLDEATPSAAAAGPAACGLDEATPSAAAAGSGDTTEVEPVLVRSAARVVLLGMGADEQCGGYGRHLTAFLKGREAVKGTGQRGEPGWAALDAEMHMDVARIWQRNLGRDDRVVSDHGREGRFPFLDEDVVALLGALPLPLLTDPRLPRGEGDKRIIRRAGDMLGLRGSSLLVKRAIQFGSRVARVTNKAVVAAAAAAAGGDASAVTGRAAMKQTRGSDAFGGLPPAGK